MKHLRTPQESYKIMKDFGELFKPKPEFDGVTYEPKFDATRLRGEMKAVYQVMSRTTSWLTLRELSQITGHPEASVSARLRDLRKSKFGSHTVERRRRGEASRGLFEYRVSRCEQPTTMKTSTKNKL